MDTDPEEIRKREFARNTYLHYTGKTDIEKDEEEFYDRNGRYPNQKDLIFKNVNGRFPKDQHELEYWIKQMQYEQKKEEEKADKQTHNYDHEYERRQKHLGEVEDIFEKAKQDNEESKKDIQGKVDEPKKGNPDVKRPEFELGPEKKEITVDDEAVIKADTKLDVEHGPNLYVGFIKSSQDRIRNKSFGLSKGTGDFRIKANTLVLDPDNDTKVDFTGALYSIWDSSEYVPVKNKDGHIKGKNYFIVKKIAGRIGPGKLDLNIYLLKNKTKVSELKIGESAILVIEAPKGYKFAKELDDSKEWIVISAQGTNLFAKKGKYINDYLKDGDKKYECDFTVNMDELKGSDIKLRCNPNIIPE